MEAGRWQQLTLAEQLGNIGSEFLRWQTTKSDKSFAETLDLLDLTLNDQRWIGKLRELTRLREVICDLAEGSAQYGTDGETLDQYFTSFAIFARK